jgi:glycosyltransferase involved in cell wall biosynthesis
MRIAVNTRFLLKEYLEGYGYFTQEIFSRLAQQHPQHEFIFIFDRPFHKQFIFSENITPVVMGPAARHPLLWKLWYDFKIPRILKKMKADVFVSPDGFCSLRTTIPQITVIHDLAFLHRPKDIPRSHLWYYKRYTPRFIKKSKQVVTVSQYSQQDIIAQYPYSAGKISVVPNAARNCFQPINWEQKEKTKEKYAGGREYFVYTGSIHPRKNIINMLKAFSIFKKWQQSDMKLLLCGRLAWKNEAFQKTIATYKYRNEVHLTGYLPEEELASVVASSYAMVYPSHFEGFGLPVVEAMQAGVPVVASGITAITETGGDAALYAPPEDYEKLAAQMMLVYKDEALRARLIEKGKVQSALFSWERASEMMWDCIQLAAGK